MFEYICAMETHMENLFYCEVYSLSVQPLEV